MDFKGYAHRAARARCLRSHDALVGLRGHPAEFHLSAQSIARLQIDNQFFRNWYLIARIPNHTSKQGLVRCLRLIECAPRSDPPMRVLRRETGLWHNNAAGACGPAAEPNTAVSNDEEYT